jgi:hypothetical protein
VNGSWQSISRWGENEGLDGDQQTAFEMLATTYVLSFYDEAIVEATNWVTYEEFVERKNGLYQLARQDPQDLENVSSDHEDYIRREKKRNLTLLEKAKILQSLVSYAKQFSQNIGHEFNDRSILLTAGTGAAATGIGGRTSASVFGYMRKTNYSRTEDIGFFKDTRLSVIDEISFASYQSTLTKISENLKSFTECREHVYGKHAICFLGDFCQLEAIGGDCIYKHRNGIYWEQALTCKVELKGTHRFNDCPDIKTIMPNI